MKLSYFLKSKAENFNSATFLVALLLLLIGLLAEIFLPSKLMAGIITFHWSPLLIINLALGGILTFFQFFAISLFTAVFFVFHSFGLNFSGLLAAGFYVVVLAFWFYVLKAVRASGLRPVVKMVVLFIGFFLFFEVLCFVVHFGQGQTPLSSGEVLVSGLLSSFLKIYHGLLGKPEVLVSGLLSSFLVFLLFFGLSQDKSVGGSRYGKYIVPFLTFLVILLILFAVVFFGLSLLHTRLVFNAFEQSLLEEVKKLAEENARYHALIAEQRFSDLVFQLKRLSSLPGVQWRGQAYRNLVPMRLEETLAQYSSVGAEGNCIISENGNVGFSAGKVPKADLKYLFEQCRWVFPVEHDNDIQPLFILEKGYLYICMPIYRQSFSPADGSYPDFKRNGFLIAWLNLDVYLRTVQSLLFKEGEFHYFVYFVGKRPFLVSYAADISKDRKIAAALKAEVIDLVNKAGKGEIKRAEGERYVIASVGAKLGDVSLLSFSCIDREKELNLLRKAQQEINNRSAASFIVLILIFFGSYLFTGMFFRQLERTLIERERWLEEEIRKRFELLEVVVDNLPLGFVLCDAEGNIRLTNIFGKLFLERDAGKQVANIGETSFAAVFSKCRELMTITKKEVILAGRIYGVTCFHFSYANELLFALMLSDITEVRATQQAALVESRTLLLGEIAKSLNKLIVKPIQVALAQTEILMAKEGISDEDRKILKDIELQLKKIADTTVTFQALGIDFSTQDKIVIDFKEALQSALIILGPVLERYDVEVRIDIDKTVFITGNWTRMQLALLTILNYVVELLKEASGKRSINFDVEETDDRVVIKISYIAPPSSPEIEKLFEMPFFTDAITGTAMSIFLARELLERDGGILLYKSSPEGLQQFILDLPKE